MKTQARQRRKRLESRGRGGLVTGIHLLAGARQDVEAARSQAARGVHTAMVGLYWDIGRRIRKASAQEKGEVRADRTASLVATLARALSRLHGRAYGEESLLRMLRFAHCYPTRAAWEPFEGLRWSHWTALLALSEARERDFYASECLRGVWSPVHLREQIKGLFYARSAWTRNAQGKAKDRRPARVQATVLTGSLAGDPDIGDFIGCGAPDHSDQRGAVLRSMEDHLLGLEAGLCLVERSKRFQVGPDDHYLDLLFYHRRLRRLFAVVLDLGPSAPHKDLMDFYLTWLDRQERQPGENSPVGISLAADTPVDRLTVRHLKTERSGVAWYQTALPPRALLHRFFLQALASARASTQGER